MKLKSVAEQDLEARIARAHCRHCYVLSRVRPIVSALRGIREAGDLGFNLLFELGTQHPLGQHPGASEAWKQMAERFDAICAAAPISIIRAVDEWFDNTEDKHPEVDDFNGYLLVIGGRVTYGKLNAFEASVLDTEICAALPEVELAIRVIDAMGDDKTLALKRFASLDL